MQIEIVSVLNVQSIKSSIKFRIPETRLFIDFAGAILIVPACTDVTVGPTLS